MLEALLREADHHEGFVRFCTNSNYISSVNISTLLRLSNRAPGCSNRQGGSAGEPLECKLWDRPRSGVAPPPAQSGCREDGTGRERQEADEPLICGLRFIKMRCAGFGSGCLSLLPVMAECSAHGQKGGADCCADRRLFIESTTNSGSLK